MGLQGGIISIIGKFFAIAITVIAALALAATLLGASVSPESIPQLSLLTLCAPIIYIINIIIMLLWIIAWKKYVFIPAAILILGMSQGGLLLQPDFKKEYNNNLPAQTLNIISYNIGGFTHKCRGLKSNLDSIVSLFNRENPDIICIQEFRTLPNATQEDIDSMMGMWPYKRVFSFAQRIYAPSIAVYSKKKILNAEYIQLNHKRGYGAVMCDILIEKGDTIRLFTTHLQSTQISNNDITYLTEEQFSDSTNREDRLWSIFNKLSQNSKIRASHADSLRTIIDKRQYRTIICGDFNDTPLSYTYNKIRGDFDDSFIQSGKGFRSTFNQLFGMMCIDYILHSNDMISRKFNILDVEFSDHYPITAQIELMNTN